jgi:septal ring factor EnvC (AmiA/AmiB activator)
VLMKILLNFSPPSAYDRLVHVRDDADVSVEEMQQEARRTVEQAEQELLVMAEQERVDRQKEAVLARRDARLMQAERERAAAAARAAAEQRAAEQRAMAVPEPTTEETLRRPWDTGPIRGLAARTLRTVTRRNGERVPEPV